MKTEPSVCNREKISGNIFQQTTACVGTNLFSFLVHSKDALFCDTQEPGNQFILSFHFFLQGNKISK